MGRARRRVDLSSNHGTPGPRVCTADRLIIWGLHSNRGMPYELERFWEENRLIHWRENLTTLDSSRSSWPPSHEDYLCAMSCKRTPPTILPTVPFQPPPGSFIRSNLSVRASKRGGLCRILTDSCRSYDRDRTPMSIGVGYRRSIRLFSTPPHLISSTTFTALVASIRLSFGLEPRFTF